MPQACSWSGGEGAYGPLGEGDSWQVLRNALSEWFWTFLPVLQLPFTVWCRDDSYARDTSNNLPHTF